MVNGEDHNLFTDSLEIRFQPLLTVLLLLFQRHSVTRILCVFCADVTFILSFKLGFDCTYTCTVSVSISIYARGGFYHNLMRESH